MLSKTLKKPRSSGSILADPSSRTDEELLLNYRETGDRAAFAELVRRYERELYSYLRRYLGNAAAAEDAFQATFFQVHLKCRQFEAGRTVRPWLYTIATHQAIDAQRRSKRHRMLSLDRKTRESDDVGSLGELIESAENQPSGAVESEEQRRWTREAVDALPEGLRSVVVLVYYQGLKYREAAEVLGVPVGTVKSRMHTAIARLGAAWNASHDSSEAIGP